MNASCHLNPNKGIWAGQLALSRGLYTNVTECSCFSVRADKLFKVLGMSVIVPSTTVPLHPPNPRHLLSLILCLMLFQWTVQQTQKHENAKRFRPGYLCLISLCSRTQCIDQQAGRYCSDKQRRTAAKNNFWRWLATPPSFSPPWFSDPPLFASPYSLSRCAHCHFFSFQVFIFKALMCPVDFLRRLIRKEKLRERGSRFFSFSHEPFQKYASSTQLPNCCVNDWGKKQLKAYGICVFT